MAIARGPQFLYHGTNVDFEPGSMITPQSVDARVHAKPSVEGVVFATTNYEMADHYANTAAESKGGTPYIFAVEPSEDMERLKEGSTHTSKTGFKVSHKMAEDGKAYIRKEGER
jgi:hypothetical protein